MKWPGKAEYAGRRTSIPPDHIREYTEKSLENLGVPADRPAAVPRLERRWADDDGWQRAVDDLKRERLVRAIGISVNRWEPSNVLRALQTGLIDSVQVVYNIFDQAPEDELFPYCQAHDIAVIARVPFDEGSLTGTLTPASRWPDGDWRNIYFNPRPPGGDARRASIGSSRSCPRAWICRSWRCGSSWSTRRSARRFPACGGPRTSSATWPPATAIRLPPRLGEALRRRTAGTGCPDATPVVPCYNRWFPGSGPRSTL